MAMSIEITTTADSTADKVVQELTCVHLDGDTGTDTIVGGSSVSADCHPAARAAGSAIRGDLLRNSRTCFPRTPCSPAGSCNTPTPASWTLTTRPQHPACVNDSLDRTRRITITAAMGAPSGLPCELPSYDAAGVTPSQPESWPTRSAAVCGAFSDSAYSAWNHARHRAAWPVGGLSRYR